jgi:hypothetical protein
VVKFALVVFILHIFVKAGMIYSALTVTVVLSMMGKSIRADDGGEEGRFAASIPKHLEVESACSETSTPISKSLGVTFSSDVEERSYSREDNHRLDGETRVAFSPGVPGLVSPAFPR